MELVRVGDIVFRDDAITWADLHFGGNDQQLPPEEPMVLACVEGEEIVFRGDSAVLMRKYLLHHVETDLEKRFGEPPAREPSAADLVEVGAGEQA